MSRKGKRKKIKNKYIKQKFEKKKIWKNINKTINESEKIPKIFECVSLKNSKLN